MRVKILTCFARNDLYRIFSLQYYYQSMNIALYGFMGSGKSSLGKALADKLGYDFIDLDREIEVFEKKSIPEIFSEKGEIYFRKIEHDVLKTIMKKNLQNIVLSLGGGTIIQPSNRLLLKIKDYKKVYLNVELNMLINRLKKDKQNRPIINRIATHEFDSYISALFETRKHIYDEFADIDIKIEKEDFRTSLEKVFNYLSMN